MLDIDKIYKLLLGVLITTVGIFYGLLFLWYLYQENKKIKQITEQHKEVWIDQRLRMKAWIIFWATVPLWYLIISRTLEEKPIWLLLTSIVDFSLMFYMIKLFLASIKLKEKIGEEEKFK